MSKQDKKNEPQIPPKNIDEVRRRKQVPKGMVEMIARGVCIPALATKEMVSMARVADNAIMNAAVAVREWHIANGVGVACKCLMCSAVARREEAAKTADLSGVMAAEELIGTMAVLTVFHNAVRFKEMIKWGEVETQMREAVAKYPMNGKEVEGFVTLAQAWQKVNEACARVYSVEKGAGDEKEAE